MPFFDTVKEVVSNKPLHLKAPDFYKKDINTKHQLEQLKEFSKTCSKDVKAQVEKDICALSKGMVGEGDVAYELMTSYLQIIVLQDLHLEFDGRSTQIDFLVITTKFNLVIECKNLYGNIEIDSNGNFIRKTRYKGFYNIEGMYNPLTQNRKHLDMIRTIGAASKGNFLTKTIFEKGFDETYKSVVVLANPKTLLDIKNAKKEIKDQIIRCDHLIDYIKNLLKESKSPESLEKWMYGTAEYLYGFHTPNTTNYLKKYGVDTEASGDTIVNKVSEPALAKDENKASVDKPDQSVINPQQTAPEAIVHAFNLEGTPIYIALKKYRYDTSKEEGVKPYFLFSNAQMLDVISKMPGTLEDLKKISGFGDVKCQKYGEAILEIVRANRQ